MTKRAAIYARVSTDEQAERGYSLPSQIEACQRYADMNDMAVVAVFQDDYSGAKLKRPEFTKLREMMKRHELDAVIIYCSDRLTRNLAHSLILRDEFQSTNVERHSVMRGKSGDNAESRMTENIESVFAEYEREKIRERMSRGRWQKARAGKYVCNGKPPYGYHYDKQHSQLVIYEPEAEVVRRIYKLYVTGDRRGKTQTIHAIAKQLSEQGILTPSNSGDTKHRRTRTAWSAFTVRWIITNETYCGTARFGRSIGQGGKEGYRDLDQQIAIPVPAIVDRVMWEAAQERIKYNAQMSIRNCKNDYMLRGLIKCGRCGSAMTGGFYRDWRKPDVKRLYYRCCQPSHRIKGIDTICRASYMPASKLEPNVWNELLSVLYSEHFEDDLQKAHEMSLADIQPERDELRQTEQALTHCESEMKEFVSMLKSAKGDLMRRSIESQVNECEQSYASLKKEQARLQKEMAQSIITADEIQNINRFRHDVIDGLQNPTLDDFRQMLEACRAVVTITDSEGRLDLHFPRYVIRFEIGTFPLPLPPCTQSRQK